MAIVSACIPLPSEIIMPFAGYLAFKGQFSLIGVPTVGAIGQEIVSMNGSSPTKLIDLNVVLALDVDAGDFARHLVADELEQFRERLDCSVLDRVTDLVVIILAMAVRTSDATPSRQQRHGNKQSENHWTKT